LVSLAPITITLSINADPRGREIAAAKLTEAGFGV